MMRLVLIVILAFIALSTTASATVLHVPSQYYSTIQAGIAFSVNGDTVLVAPGVYTENIIFGGKNIKIIGSAGSTSTFLQPYSTSIPIVQIVNGEDSTAQLTGFTIQNSGNSRALCIMNSSPVISRCIFYHNMVNYFDDSPIRTQGSAAPLITYNLMNDNGGVANVWFDSPTLFINNTLVNSQRAGILPYNDGVIIKNNIVVGCPLYGTYACGYQQPTADYNDFYQNNPNYNCVDSGSHSISVDPMFVGPGNGDFRLMFNSPCINAGDPSLPNDPDGTRADMGALGFHHTLRSLWNVSVGGSDTTGDGSEQNPFRTIQQGINVSDYGDTVLVYDGHYYERISFLGKAITVASQHLLDSDTLHIANTIIDADTLVLGVADTGSVVRFVNGEDSTSVLHGFTIQYGGGGDLGHGIFCFGECSPLIEDCTIIHNASSGIFITTYGSVEILRCRINENGNGGVHLYYYCNAFLENCVISQNSGSYAFFASGSCKFVSMTGCLIIGNEGDGIYVRCASSYTECIIQQNGGDGAELWGPATLISCVIAQNLESGIDIRGTNIIEIVGSQINSNGAGGIRYSDGEGFLNIRDSDISLHDGYGIMAWGDSALIDRCTFVSNAGGGLRGRRHVSINNCVFEDNSAVKGGAVYLDYPNAYHHTLRGCTFISNSASEGSAIYFGSSYYQDTVMIGNCLISFNNGGPAIACSSSVLFPAINCTDIFGNPGGDWAACIADQANINGNFSANPYFCDTTNRDYTLFAVSPCLPENNNCSQQIGALGQGCLGLSAFHLLAPPLESVVTYHPIRLLWQGTIDSEFNLPVQYRVFLDDDPAFVSPDSFGLVEDTLAWINDTLIASARYFWRVRATDHQVPPRWSAETFSFYIDSPPALPAIINPENGDRIGGEAYMTWLWSTDPDSFDAVSYSIQVDDDSAFASPEIDQSGLLSENLALDDAFAIRLGELEGHENLQMDTRYFWRVRADDNYGLHSDWTDGSNWFIFMAQNHAPSPPDSGFSPANGEEVIPLRPVITWNNASDPDADDHPGTLSYALRLSTDSVFVGFVLYDTTAMGINQIQPVAELADNTCYFYNIKTIDDGGLSSGWSAIQNFWTNHYNFPPEPFPLYAPNNGQRQVVYYTNFSWGNTVDYDPNSSFTFSIQYSPDSLFRYDIGTLSGLTDTATSIVTDSLAISGLVYWRVLAIDDDSLSRTGGLPEGPRSLLIIPPGDANTNGVTNGIDATFMVAYLKGQGAAPDPIQAGDANGNCTTNGIDVVYLVAYLKGIGAPPVRPDCGEAIAGSPKSGNKQKIK